MEHESIETEQLPQQKSSLPVGQDVLWALSLVEGETELLEAQMTSLGQEEQPAPDSFPEKLMQVLSQNKFACAIGAKTPEPILNLLYWGLNRPLAPVLGTAGAVLMCPVCVYSSGLIVIGMLWWGAKTPRPSSDSASQAS